ncbi:MAG: 1-acyl-sn-glycerol-3-phosphate acyltransferase [Planctomycetes bacterium]|nr:1-acyl-sn-glycerol-3-phosphate acyltransferase [Planctomycetota bacterium]
MFARLRSKQPGASLPRLLFYEFACVVFRAVSRMCFKARVHFPERVPATGPLLLAANHQSFLDPPLIGIRLRQRHLTFIARSGLFKSPAFAAVISWLNALPIREDASDAGAIKETIARLQGGSAVLIFPEGSRCDDGAIGPFKRGVALLMKKARCPVVPVAIEGAFDAWPNSRKRPRFTGCRVEVMYGAPISHEELMKDGPDAALARLALEIDSMRMQLRRGLREATAGKFPAAGAGDAPFTPRNDPRPASRSAEPTAP